MILPQLRLPTVRPYRAWRTSQAGPMQDRGKRARGTATSASSKATWRPDRAARAQRQLVFLNVLLGGVAAIVERADAPGRPLQVGDDEGDLREKFARSYSSGLAKVASPRK